MEYVTGRSGAEEVKPLPASYKKYIIILALSLAAFAVLSISFMFKGLVTTILDQVDNTFYTQFLYVRERFDEDVARKDSGIVVVGIDDRTLNKLGAFSPMKYREYHIDLLANILAGQPAGVAYDILFSDPHPDPEVDRRFADTMRQGPVFAVFSVDDPDRSDGAFSSYGYELPAHVDMEFVRESGFERWSSTILDGLTSIGLANAYPDNDGLIRKMPVFFRFEDALYPTIAFEVFRNVAGIPKKDVRVEEGRVLVGDTAIPVDRDCRAYVNIDGSYDIREIPFYDVWKGRVPPRYFRDKMVFVAATATGMGDNKLVPLYGYISGVLIHANLFLNLKSRSFIHEVTGNLYYLVVFLASLLYTFIFYSRSNDSTPRKILNLLSRLAPARKLGESLLGLSSVDRMVRAFERARERHYGLRLFFLLFTETRKRVEPLILHLVLLYSALSLTFYFFHVFIRPSAMIIQMLLAYIIVEHIRDIDFSTISPTTQRIGAESSPGGA